MVYRRQNSPDQLTLTGLFCVPEVWTSLGGLYPES
jgi:hypothetical protein